MQKEEAREFIIKTLNECDIQCNNHNSIPIDNVIVAMCYKLRDLDNRINSINNTNEILFHTLKKLEEIVASLLTDKMKQFEIGSQEYEHYKDLRDKCLNNSIIKL